jgi:hypothetical protein
VNLALFYSTALRLTRPGSAFLIFLYGVILPVLASYTLNADTVFNVVRELILGPVVPMLIAYSLVKDEIGNSRSLNNGEYLTLLFTRPLSRVEYVMSKWTVCSLFVAVIVLIAFVSFAVAETIQGRPPGDIFSIYTIANVILNAFGATAAIVLLNSFPPKIGIAIFMLVIYGSMLAALLAEKELAKAKDSWAALFFTAITQTCAFVRASASPYIDTYSVFTAISFSWTPVLTYISNISLFLLIAVLILNKREFFYASE